METAVSKLPRKRAPRCTELDNPIIRKEIEFRYGTLGWKLDSVVEDINNAYNLNATKIQYRERLNKWGCRQRLNHEEYKTVHQDVSSRQALGKRSRVFLNETTELPEKRLKRWAAKNITFTSQMFSKGNFTASHEIQSTQKTLGFYNTRGLVRTPSPNPEMFLLPVIKKHVAICSPYSPIGQLYNYLEQTLAENLWPGKSQGSLIKAEGSHLQLPLLGVIIYRISNNINVFDKKHVPTPVLLYGDFDGDGDGSVSFLLDLVDEYGLRGHLRELLSNDSPSILAACSTLATIFYFRGDNEMLQFIYKRHPKLKKTLYSHLNVVRSQSASRAYIYRGIYAEDIISDISNENLAPESAQEAYDLLFACKNDAKDVSVFCRLWNPLKVPIQELESYRDPHEETMSFRLSTRLRNAPLYTTNAQDLKLLLECGFSSFKYSTLFNALMENWDNLAQVVCNNLGIALDKADVHGSKASYHTNPKHAWELLDKAIFYDIAAKSALEIIPAQVASSSNLGGLDPDHLLMYAACMNPPLASHALEILQWKYSISAQDASNMAIELLFEIEDGWVSWMCQQFFEKKSYASRRDFDVPSVLETILRYGIDPNGTSFWTNFIWMNLISYTRFNSEYYKAKKILKIFLDAGANVDRDLDMTLWEKTNPNTCENNLDPNILNYPEYKESKTPLEIAFLLKRSSVFRLLIKRSASIDRLYHKLVSGKYGEINPTFLHALESRDVGLIKEHWDDRIQSPNAKVISALLDGAVDTAKNIVLGGDSSLVPIALALDIADLILSNFKNPSLYANGIKILKSILETGVEFSSKQGFWDTRHQVAVYHQCLLGCIVYDDTRLLKVLLDFCSNKPSSELGINFPRYHPIQEHRIHLLNDAANHSLDCLKLLVEQGFHIDDCTVEETRRLNPNSRTALSGAIEIGDLKILAYVLSEGANIYVPCGRTSSAIELAISKGRIDCLAMILEAVPNSYALAVATAEDPQYKDEYIAEYVRSWNCTDKGMDMGGTIMDITSDDSDPGSPMEY